MLDQHAGRVNRSAGAGRVNRSAGAGRVSKSAAKAGKGA